MEGGQCGKFFMRILVTGADGFVGSHLCEYLVKKGHTVRALCFYNSFGSRGWLEQSEYLKDMEIVFGDIRDPNRCNKISNKVQVVINLAALISIPYSYDAPLSYFQTNVLGTINLCESALKNAVEKYLQISTSEVYGSAIYTPIDEKHPIQPQSPYSASKVSSDAVVYSYAKSFNLPAIIARPFNTFGPRQSVRAIIPTIITQMLTKKSTIKLGNLNSIRDFNYVENTTDAIESLLSIPFNNLEVFNIGSGQSIDVKTLYNKLSQFIDYKGVLEVHESKLRPEKSEVDELLCNFDKLKKTIGYTPKIDFDVGLKKTINWFLLKKDLYETIATTFN